MRETREQMAARLDEYADVWANEGTPDADVTALRAGAAALRAQGWQPIETAPTAVNVLVVDQARSIEVARRHEEYGWLSKPGRYAVVPTHWMPLPSPPEAD